MSQKKFVIIEDELPVAEQIKRLVKTVAPDYVFAGMAHTVDDAKLIIGTTQPDLVLLDIKLGMETGFDVLKSFEQPAFHVIIITGYDTYGIEAVKCSAVDYLLKPVSATELDMALKKAEARMQQKNGSQQDEIANMLIAWQSHLEKSHFKLVLPLNNEQLLVSPMDITRLEAMGSYTRFFFQTGPHIMVSKGIYEFDQKLEQHGFLRCHKSHSVNKNYIRKILYQHGCVDLEMQDGMKIPVSRKLHKEIKELVLFR
jgi:two-component system LytT family response regulator